MGKSTVASQLALLGAKVCSADSIVHRLMKEGGEAVAQIREHFPAAVKNGIVDRRKLGDIVFASEEKRRLLEQIIHPLVVEEEEHFIDCERRRGAKLVVLDIPLLFETGADSRCDLVIVASAPYFIQKQRVLARPRMTPQRFQQILAQQMPDYEKRQLADIVIHTGLGKAHSMQQLKYFTETIHA